MNRRPAGPDDTGPAGSGVVVDVGLVTSGTADGIVDVDVEATVVDAVDGAGALVVDAVVGDEVGTLRGAVVVMVDGAGFELDESQAVSATTAASAAKP